jgi:heme exporter protein C
MKRTTNIDRGLIVLAGALILAALYMIFGYVPTEKEMGVVQRIFYLHVPLAWLAFLSFFVVFVASAIYLWKRQSKWDVRASAAAEVGVVFTTLFLISGIIWAKPIWGVWWTWDPRLTSALVLWLIYVAYLLVRTYAPDSQRGSRFAAVVGVVGFVDVPIVALAITLWRTQHPSAVIFEDGLAPPMLATLLVNITAFTVFYIVLMRLRIAQKHAENALREIKIAAGLNTR